MDKKDIYEHLAKIYLDASTNSSENKEKSKKHLLTLKPVMLFSVIAVFGFAFFSFSRARLNESSLNSEIALVLSDSAAKINFNFNPAKKEVYVFDLNGLNIGRFSAIGFRLKNAASASDVTFKVEFVNRFKEKSEVYLRDIPHKWQDYKINLSEFKNINNWSSMSGLSFSVEEWNAQGKKGVVYIDNVSLLK
jgi:hypothetical protein